MRAATKYAVIKRDGSFLIKPRREKIVSLNDERFAYCVLNKPGPDCSIWIVNADGKKQLLRQPSGAVLTRFFFEPSLQSWKAAPKEKTFFRSEHGRSVGLVNEKGACVLPPTFIQIGELTEGHVLTESEGYIQVFDEHGKLTGNVASNLKIRFGSEFRGGIAPVQDRNEKIGFINFQGKLVIPCKYDKLLEDSNSLPMLEYTTKVQGTIYHKTEWITRSGELIEPPNCEFNEIISCNERFGFLIRSESTDHKYGIIDADGQTVLPCIYEQIGYNPKGYLTRKDSHLTLFDFQGKTVLKFYESIIDARVTHDSLIGVAIKTTPDTSTTKLLWGLMNFKGSIVVKPKYAELESFVNDLAPACIIDHLDDPKWGLIDRNGTWQVKPTFDGIAAGKTRFLVKIEDPHFFDPQIWKENDTHYSDLKKLFRDKQVIGMSRDQLVKLIGLPAKNTGGSTYCTYTVEAGGDGSLLIDFDFDNSEKVYRWRMRSRAAFKESSSLQWKYSEEFV